MGELRWFASGYDTDDWVYRLMTMLQMVGTIILALGIPPVTASIERGAHVDNRLMVAGYVMRIAMVAQWIRAARQDPDRRRMCLTYAVTITVAQLGWVGIAIAETSVPVTFLLAALMTLVELAGMVVRRRSGNSALTMACHHIAERYGLLTIIALGEGVIGTVAASLGDRPPHKAGASMPFWWRSGGTGLTFGCGGSTSSCRQHICCLPNATRRCRSATGTSRCSRRSCASAPVTRRRLLHEGDIPSSVRSPVWSRSGRHLCRLGVP